MSFLKARSWQTLAVAAVVALALTLSLGAFAQTASADAHLFTLDVYHGINGNAIGLEKELPVDVWVNGEVAIPNLQFKDKLEGIELPAGDYWIQVSLHGTEPPVIIDSMSIGSAEAPVSIPGGVNVDVHAKLSGGKTPVLKVKVN